MKPVRCAAFALMLLSSQSLMAQTGSAKAAPPAVSPAVPPAKHHGPPPAMIDLNAAPKAGDLSEAPRLVEVELVWSAQGMPGKLRFFELSQQSVERLGESRSVRNAARALPIVREITDGKIQVNSNNYKMVAMVVENPMNEPLYFFASPHSTEPVGEGLGIKFICLCNGFVYRAKPGMYWYRIMQVKIHPANRVPKFKLMHLVRRVDPKDLPSTSDQIGE